MARLNQLLHVTSLQHPNRPALIEPDGRQADYSGLATRTALLARILAGHGVGQGCTVCLAQPKDIEAVVSIFAIMEAGAAYVPLDIEAPLNRNAFIIEDCRARAVLACKDMAKSLSAALSPTAQLAMVPLEAFSIVLLLLEPKAESSISFPENLAYILYTSGSTGLPKGVMITHDNAYCFVEWAANQYDISERDVVSSIAPFHFDLSIFDLYAAVARGACIILVNRKLAQSPMMLASLIEKYKINLWYATPTLLKLMLRFGQMGRWDHSSLRLVLFAGEVFPIPALSTLMAHWPTATFYNLYGPTETNVVTFQPIPSTIPPEQESPFPAGRCCPYAQARILLDEELVPPAAGMEGELLISGASVMAGYLNLPEENAEAFIQKEGKQWYRTGDIFRVLASGALEYRNRKGRMVKRRGFRIELGEIEVALYQHPEIVEASCLSICTKEGETDIRAFYSTASKVPLPLVSLKTFLAERLPAYMLPGQLIHLPAHPKTSTDKINYQALKEMAVAE